MNSVLKEVVPPCSCMKGRFALTCTKMPGVVVCLQAIVLVDLCLAEVQTSLLDLPTAFGVFLPVNSSSRRLC